MIERLDINSTYLDILEENFAPDFTKQHTIFDISNNSFTHYYTYIIDDKPVAFINYQIMYERAELIQINVLDNYQSQGIASKLMEKMLEDCINNKVESITLEVKETNNKARHLYEKYDFTQIGVRKGYYQGIDGILMERKLI